MQATRFRKCPRCGSVSLSPVFDGVGYSTGDLRCDDCRLSAPVQSPAWFVLASPRGSLTRPVIQPIARPHTEDPSYRRDDRSF